MAFPAITGIDMTGACHECCGCFCPSDTTLYGTYYLPEEPSVHGMTFTFTLGPPTWNTVTTPPYSDAPPSIGCVGLSPDCRILYVNTFMNLSGNAVTEGTIVSTSPLIITFPLNMDPTVHPSGGSVTVTN